MGSLAPHGAGGTATRAAIVQRLRAKEIAAQRATTERLLLEARAQRQRHIANVITARVNKLAGIEVKRKHRRTRA